MKPFHGQEQYWRVVLLCFIAATTFWLLNALNKNYSNVRVSYPIRFVYDQQEYIALKPLPEEIAINVSGKGWKLLRKYLMLDVQPADIPMQGFINRKSVPANVFRPTVSNALDGLELNFIVTDSIRFRFDRQITRKIPLAVDTLQLGINANYILIKPITITPAEVEFEGPASVLDSLPDPFVLKLPKTTLTKPFKSYLPIDYPYKDLVKSDIVEAEIAFEVKPLSWQNLALVPTILNPPATGSIFLQPALVNVKYGFVAGQDPPINPEQFNVTVDLTQVNAQDSMATVQLRQKPAAAKHVAVYPLQVKVIRTPQ